MAVILQKNKKKKWSEHFMQCQYYRKFGKRRLAIIPNIKYWTWESDLLAITKSFYLHGIEIKRSRSDYRHEIKKHYKFEAMARGLGPNKFYYMVPDNLITLDEVNEKYGLKYIMKYGSIEIIREATFLHKNKVLEKGYISILEKCYWKMWKYKKMIK